MSFENKQLFVTKTDDSLYTVFSAVSVDLAAIIQTDRASFIEADEVIVDGVVSTHTFPLTIICRNLVFNAEAAIVADGPPAQFDYSPGVFNSGSNNPGGQMAVKEVRESLVGLPAM